MKSVYTIPVLICALGIGLMVAGNTEDTNVSVFGFTMMSLLVQRVGLVVLILSMIGFLAAYGSTLPPTRRAQVDKPDHSGDAHGKVEDLAGPRRISRSA